MATVLTQLRSLAPRRPEKLTEALLTADAQAEMLLRLSRVTVQPVPDSVVTSLPRVHVERLDLGETAGATQWSLGRWVILINNRNVRGRQRFSLFHELKHIIDHPLDETALPTDCTGRTRSRVEQICDYFAGSVLMPRAWVAAVWRSGVTDIAALARLFEVSAAAMRVRLLQIGLIHSPTQPGRYY